MVVRELFQVKLIYKSYFHAKWKSKAMQPCSPSSSRASPLHLTYKRRVGGQLAERCVACEPGVAHTGWSVRITLLPGIYQTCYLIDGEHYYASLTRRVVDPHHVLSDCNLYRIDVDTKVPSSPIRSSRVRYWLTPCAHLAATAALAGGDQEERPLDQAGRAHQDLEAPLHHTAAPRDPLLPRRQGAQSTLPPTVLVIVESNTRAGCVSVAGGRADQRDPAEQRGGRNRGQRIGGQETGVLPASHARPHLRLLLLEPRGIDRPWLRG